VPHPVKFQGMFDHNVSKWVEFSGSRSKDMYVGGSANLGALGRRPLVWGS